MKNTVDQLRGNFSLEEKYVSHNAVSHFPR